MSAALGALLWVCVIFVVLVLAGIVAAAVWAARVVRRNGITESARRLGRRR